MTDNPNSTNGIPVTLQPGLGRHKDNYKPGNNIGSFMCLARVTKVHHKHGTIDVQLLKTRDNITSSEENEGRWGARILTSNGHYDNLYWFNSSGVSEPIQEDQVVVLAFLDELKNQPIILGSFHNTFEIDKNILLEDYPIDIHRSLEEYREGLRYLRVFPSQLYFKADGIGAIESSLPSKSFFKIDPDFEDIITDDHLEYDHEDLLEKDPETKLTRHGKREEALYPLKFLFIHRDSYIDGETTWTKFFINQVGTFRITRENRDEKLTFTEMTNDGRYLIRRQQDSPKHYEGDLHSEIIIEKNGRVQLKNKVLSGESTITIMQDGVIELEHFSGSIMTFDNAGNITISARTITISAGSDLNLLAGKDVNIQSGRNVNIN